MKYPHIKAAKLSHKQIAKAFGYKNVNSFRGSTAHKRHMQGVENILKLVFKHTDDSLKAGVSVLYNGEVYETGNRYHNLVELYQNHKFVITVLDDKIIPVKISKH